MDAASTRALGLDRSGAAIGKLPIAALLFGAIGFALFPDQLRNAWATVLLTGLALAAHLMPVDLFRSGIRVVFALPFVAAIAVSEGASAAFVAELGVSAIVGLYALGRQPQLERIKCLVLNLGVSGVSVGSGLLAASFASAIGPASVGRDLFQALMFVSGYATANLALVMGGRVRQGPDRVMLGPILRGVGIYALLAVAVSALVAEGFAWLAPLALVPVWSLREALGYQARVVENYLDTIGALNQMLQRAHPYTHGHLERVASAAEQVALRMGLSGSRARMVREAAILHDIGKIAVDEEILDKPAKLTPEEFDHVRKHSEWGAQILAPVQEFSEIAIWIRHHHERPDGSGYPDRLSDVEIPLESKIIAVVDAYDAMTGFDDTGCKRSYREPVSSNEALDELVRCSGSQFDRQVVTAFRAVVKEAC